MCFRIVGTSAKTCDILLPVSLEVDEDEEETIAEHRELPSKDHMKESYVIEQLKNKVKNILIDKILEEVKEKQNVLRLQGREKRKWRKNRKTTKQKEQSKEVSSKCSTSPTKNDFLTIGSCERHPIMKSNISSAKWQKEDRDFNPFPVITNSNFNSRTRDCKRIPGNSGKGLKFVPGNFKSSSEGKTWTLPPIKDCVFQPDENHKDFFHRSSSCNTYKKRETSGMKTKSNYRANSSRVDS